MFKGRENAFSVNTYFRRKKRTFIYKILSKTSWKIFHKETKKGEREIAHVKVKKSTRKVKKNVWMFEKEKCVKETGSGSRET